MRYFQKLIIENFQSHEYTEIEFIPGLNVFVGPSDSGKSSILRALRWVLFNQPRGADFIRTGAKKCQVHLILDDGTEIIRIRSKSVNRYILRTPDGQEEVYESLGHGAHPMILQAHQMFPLVWDQKETVIQLGTQLEGPFLLSESGGAKAKLIGRLSGAHWMDQAMKETTRERNQIIGEMKQIEKHQEVLAEKLAPYDHVPELEKALKKAESAYQQAKRKKKKLERLQELANRLYLVQKERKKEEAFLEKLQIVSNLEQKQLYLEQFQYRLHQLDHLSRKWKKRKDELENVRRILRDTENLPEAETSFLHMINQRERLMILQKLAVHWREFEQKNYANQQCLQELKRLPEALSRFHRLQEQKNRIEVLSRCLYAWSSLQKTQKQHQEVLQKTEKAIDWMTHRSSWLDHQLNRYEQLLDLYLRYQEVKNRLSIGRDYLNDRIQEVVESSEQYMELLQLQGKCPTCGSKVDATLLEHLKHELYGGEKYAAVGKTDEST